MRDLLISLGIFLMILGVLLVLFGVISRFVPRLEELPPILYVQKTFNGVTVGTSPILIIAFIILYLVLWTIKLGK
ncbi:MAG: hypothetical protein QXI27_00270 [Nitrososphaerota archaeon]